MSRRNVLSGPQPTWPELLPEIALRRTLSPPGMMRISALAVAGGGKIALNSGRNDMTGWPRKSLR